jgi:hypothetical protein
MEILMTTKSIFSFTLFAAALAVSVLAQKPTATGGAALSSEPGKASAVRTVKISAEVVGLDKATRTVTLKGPEGNTVDVVAGDEVKNFDQIKKGDLVVAQYAEALTLELKKVKGEKAGVSVSKGAAKAKPGDKPAVAGARQVTLVADVVAVDPVKSTISLKGPKGNTVVLDVQNPDQFKVVKVGDQVEVTYTEALALSVEPAPKRAVKEK